jgi:hypothetical protein
MDADRRVVPAQLGNAISPPSRARTRGRSSATLPRGSPAFPWFAPNDPHPCRYRMLPSLLRLPSKTTPAGVIETFPLPYLADSVPRAYRLKVGNVYLIFSTSTGTSHRRGAFFVRGLVRIEGGVVFG